MLSCLKNDYSWGNVRVTSFEYEDKFIKHGNTKLVEEYLGILPEQIAEKILSKVE